MDGYNNGDNYWDNNPNNDDKHNTEQNNTDTDNMEMNNMNQSSMDNDGMGQNNSTPNNSMSNNSMPNNSISMPNNSMYDNMGYNNKKKNKKGQKFLIIFGSIFAGIVFIAAVFTVCKNVVDYVGAVNNRNVAVTEDGKKKTEENAGDNGNDAVATTKPVSVVESDNIKGSFLDVSDIVEETMPSVVSIVTTTSVEGYSVFGQRYQQEMAAGGTGFIVGQNDSELLLATNNHVVENATAIQVTFADEKTAEAVVKGTDAQADLAVIAVSLKDIDDDTMAAIKVAILGDSNDVKVGQMAIAIGNAQGMGQSVTVGYISAKDRKLDMQDESTGGTKTMNFLQTDAAINGGNSGGPLLNAKGEVVGISSAKISDTQVEGMCFAIPISSAIPIINDLMNRETLTDDEKGYMGVSLKNISSEAVELYGVPDGVYVASVTKDGPADKAGIKEGDIIVSVNDVSVNSSSSAVDKVTSYRAGTEITVKVYRKDEQQNGYKEMEVKVTLVTAEEAGVNKSTNQGNSQNNVNQYNDDYYDDDYDDYYYDDDDASDYDDFFDSILPW